MKVAHVEASCIVLPMVSSGMSENVLKAKEERIEKILESLNLQSIESWNEQQQQSARVLIREYQHLFALTLNELGKTSLVQHDIKLDDKSPFKKILKNTPSSI